MEAMFSLPNGEEDPHVAHRREQTLAGLEQFEGARVLHHYARAENDWGSPVILCARLRFQVIFLRGVRNRRVSKQAFISWTFSSSRARSSWYVSLRTTLVHNFKAGCQSAILGLENNSLLNPAKT